MTHEHSGARGASFFHILSLAALMFVLLTLPAVAETQRATNIPWSGWWWPYYQGGLATGIGYRQHPAPLEKYDQLIQGSYPGKTTNWYLSNYYNPDAPGWHGFCAYWAWAAISEPIDFVPSVHENIVFRVGDKKGLITVAHSDDVVEWADGSDPAIFHYWLLRYVKDQGKAFVADMDASEQVWSYPIYQYEMSVTHIPLGGRTQVEVKVYYANDFVPPDYMGTSIIADTFTYELVMSGDDVVSGQWIGDSLNFHPQQLSMPLSRGSKSPDLDYDTVRSIAVSRDDELEKAGETVTAPPGTHHLILLDEDRYAIPCAPGDRVRLIVEKQKGSELDIAYVLTDGSGAEIQQGSVSLENPLDIDFTAQTSSVFLTVNQIHYRDPNIYTLTVDIARESAPSVPYIPKNGMWSGFAVTNPGEETVNNAMLVTYAMDGAPIQTVWGPASLAPREKRLFLFDQLPWRRHEFKDMDHASLMAEGDIRLVNLFGNAGSLLAGFSGDVRASHLVIPDTSTSLDPNFMMSGAVVNDTLEDTLMYLRLYSGGGTLKKEILNEALPARGALRLGSGYPFYGAVAGGWIEVENPEAIALSAYQYIRGGAWADAIAALPVTEGIRYIPHVPEAGYWTTTVTLINPGDAANPVTFHPVAAGADAGADRSLTLQAKEKRTVDILALMGWTPDHPLARSVIAVTGSAGPVVGYFTYATPNDVAGLALPDDSRLRTDLVLPHFPSEREWWTGLGLFNPGDAPVVVRAIPVSPGGGENMAASRDIQLAAGMGTVFTIDELFTLPREEVAFVHFVSDGPAVGGFYLYGNGDNSMLSGGFME